MNIFKAFIYGFYSISIFQQDRFHKAFQISEEEAQQCNMKEVTTIYMLRISSTQCNSYLLAFHLQLRFDAYLIILSRKRPLIFGKHANSLFSTLIFILLRLQIWNTIVKSWVRKYQK